MSTEPRITCNICGKSDSDGNHKRVGVTYQDGDGFHIFIPTTEPKPDTAMEQRAAEWLEDHDIEDVDIPAPTIAIPNATQTISELLAAFARSELTRAQGASPRQEGQLTHGRNCSALTPGNEEDCTCGLQFRIYLQTEQEISAAWRKRAEESELKLASAPVGWRDVKVDGIPEEFISKQVIFGWQEERESKAGFQTSSNECCDIFGRPFKTRPTHWQPLPAAPPDGQSKEQP